MLILKANIDLVTQPAAAPNKAAAAAYPQSLGLTDDVSEDLEAELDAVVDDDADVDFDTLDCG